MRQGEGCRRDLGLATHTLVPFLRGGAEGCHCVCRGHRAAEGFKATGMSNGYKCDKT